MNDEQGGTALGKKMSSPKMATRVTMIGSLRESYNDLGGGEYWFYEGVPIEGDVDNYVFEPKNIPQDVRQWLDSNDFRTGESDGLISIPKSLVQIESFEPENKWCVSVNNGMGGYYYTQGGLEALIAAVRKKLQSGLYQHIEIYETEDNSKDAPMPEYPDPMPYAEWEIYVMERIDHSVAFHQSVDPAWRSIEVFKTIKSKALAWTEPEGELRRQRWYAVRHEMWKRYHKNIAQKIRDMGYVCSSDEYGMMIYRGTN